MVSQFFSFFSFLNSTILECALNTAPPPSGKTGLPDRLYVSPSSLGPPRFFQPPSAWFGGSPFCLLPPKPFFPLSLAYLMDSCPHKRSQTPRHSSHPLCFHLVVFPQLTSLDNPFSTRFYRSVTFLLSGFFVFFRLSPLFQGGTSTQTPHTDLLLPSLEFSHHPCSNFFLHSFLNRNSWSFWTSPTDFFLSTRSVCCSSLDPTVLFSLAYSRDLRPLAFSRPVVLVRRDEIPLLFPPSLSLLSVFKLNPMFVPCACLGDGFLWKVTPRAALSYFPLSRLLGPLSHDPVVTFLRLPFFFFSHHPPPRTLVSLSHFSLSPPPGIPPSFLLLITPPPLLTSTIFGCPCRW